MATAVGIVPHGTNKSDMSDFLVLPLSHTITLLFPVPSSFIPVSMSRGLWYTHQSGAIEWWKRDDEWRNKCALSNMVMVIW